MTITILVPLVAYLAAVRRVDAAHPANPVPRRRVAAWVGGLAVLAIALCSSVDVYSQVLFSVHMVQHMLLVFVVAPLLCLGAPMTLLLRVATPEQRTHLILPVLRSRPLRALTHPVVDWILFTTVMWVTHFSPLFELALENGWVHVFEHALFLGAGYLFWWPVVGADPGPRPLSYPVRLGYVLLQMPQNAFLGLTLFTASQALYPFYASLTLPWLPDALSDQHLGGGLMWVAGRPAVPGAGPARGGGLAARRGASRPPLRRAAGPPAGGRRPGQPIGIRMTTSVSTATAMKSRLR